METTTIGDTGAEVALVQKGLSRALTTALSIDGIFGIQTQNALRRFQAQQGLPADGIFGPQSYRALLPWLHGFRRYTIRPGDSLWRIAQRFGIPLAALETANPGLDPFDLRPGSAVSVPLPFAVVPEDVPMSAALAGVCTEGLAARYPFLRAGHIGYSVLGRPLHSLRFGHGPRRVLYTAAHHANEWITASLLFLFTERLAAAYASDGELGGVSAQALLASCEIVLVPLVDPDGVDLVTGALKAPAVLRSTREIAAEFPAIPYPDGWKANIRGTDLNLQYPAEWESARGIKFAQGYTRPAPRDFVGTAPLTAPESLALRDFTRRTDPALILAYHTQGEVIYPRFGSFDPPGARELAARFAFLSGYAVEDTPYASSFAGYKDWFIQDFDRPGFTIEAGLGENPLPLAQLPSIFAKNLGILLAAAQD